MMNHNMSFEEVREQLHIQNIKEMAKRDVSFELIEESNIAFKIFFQLPLAKNLDKSQALELFGCMSREELKAGQLIYEAGSPTAGEMYLILDGKVNVQNESGYKYTSLRQGDVFGLFSFLDETRKHSATLTVERDISALCLKRSYFDLVAKENPILGNQLMHFMFSLLSKKALEMEVEYAHMHNFAFGGKV